MKTSHSIMKITKGTSTNVEGLTLYIYVKDYIERKETVVLSWQDSMGISSSFLNSFLGELLDNYEIGTIQTYVKFIDLSKTQSKNLKEYIEKYRELKAS